MDDRERAREPEREAAEPVEATGARRGVRLTDRDWFDIAVRQVRTGRGWARTEER